MGERMLPCKSGKADGKSEGCVTERKAIGVREPGSTDFECLNPSFGGDQSASRVACAPLPGRRMVLALSTSIGECACAATYVPYPPTLLYTGRHDVRGPS